MSGPLGRDEIESLIGAYALDAVTPEERAAVEDLLATDPRLRDEADDYREVAALIAYGGADAPDEIWQGIQHHLDGAEEAPTDLVLPFERPQQSRRTAPWLAALGGAVAAALLVVLGFAVFRDSSSPSSDDSDLMELAATAAFEDVSARTAEFSVETPVDGPVRVAVLEDGRGFLMGDSLPVLSGDKTYQLWGAAGEEVISLGVLGADPGIAAFEAGPGVTTLMLTEEMSGGVGQSQNPAVGVAELS